MVQSSGLQVLSVELEADDDEDIDAEEFTNQLNTEDNMDEGRTNDFCEERQNENIIGELQRGPFRGAHVSIDKFFYRVDTYNDYGTPPQEPVRQQEEVEMEVTYEQSTEMEFGTEDVWAMLPEVFRHPKTVRFIERLIEKEVLDRHCRPLVDRRSVSILADYMGNRFHISGKWKAAADLMGEDKEVLRTTFNRVVSDNEYRRFISLLDKL